MKEREDLLACDFTTNAALRNQPDSMIIKLDPELEHHSRLSAVGRRIDEMLASGSASLTALRDQGCVLYGTNECHSLVLSHNIFDHQPNCLTPIRRLAAHVSLLTSKKRVILNSVAQILLSVMYVSRVPIRRLKIISSGYT